MCHILTGSSISSSYPQQAGIVKTTLSSCDKWEKGVDTATLDKVRREEEGGRGEEGEGEGETAYQSVNANGSAWNAKQFYDWLGVGRRGERGRGEERETMHTKCDVV